MFGKIEPRYGAEVYISETDKICIKQNQGDHDDVVLIFDEGELDSLIGYLQDAKRSLDESRRVAEENENN